MDIKDKERLTVLLSKQLNGKCTEEMKSELSKLVESLDDESLTSELKQQWHDYKPVVFMSEMQSATMLSSILSAHVEHTKSLRHLYYRIAGVAAVIIFVLIAGYFAYNLTSENNATKVVTEQVLSMSEPVSYTRRFVLPDGSTVILKPNSKLICAFVQKYLKREVYLSGEAYFDVRHHPSKPFIVHTGRITTTVLGTAFNIYAKEGDVHVAVTRGRVRVANTQRTLVILSANEELLYHSDDTYTVRSNPSVTAAVNESIGKEMNFNHYTLAKIVQVLEHRYGVSIDIENPQLSKMVFVTSFAGTESVQEVLDVLCRLSSDMEYHINGSRITITQR
jgi:transmembrane sensor